MARTRARRMSPAGAVSAPETIIECAEPQPAPDFDEFVEETLFEEAPPEAPKPARAPPLLMLVVDEEEEVEFCAPPPESPPLQVIQGSEDETDSADEAEFEPPFDPPDLEDLLASEEDNDIADDEEPPFDPADLEDLTPPSLSVPVATEEPLLLAPANENARASLGPARNAQSDGARNQPAPAIRIYLSWDRREAAGFFKAVSADPRLSRTEITTARGGLDGAAVHCAAHRPDLVVVDTTLRGAALIASLDRLMEAAGRHTRVIVLGAVNDVSLLREMAQRGVDEYLIWPIKPEDVVGSACALFADVDKARVIAVVGARGGLGASTIAHNLAWCIAERQHARTTLVDLDMPFGTAAFDFKVEPIRSLADVMQGDALDDVALERVGVKRTERLTILSAPSTPRRGGDVDAEAAQALIAAARRLSSYVVLDLPHLWTPWVKQALLAADEIVLVTSPDIASLRNTDNIAKALRNERPTEPVVVLSMMGIPKRPEVPFKEFAEALTLTPACSFAFEPNLYGAATITGQMLPEIAPDSKTAALIKQLATLLTGRECFDAAPAAPAIFEEERPDEGFDPFEDGLVNCFALECDEAEIIETLASDPQTLSPLELLELTPLEPEYLAKARAAAFDALDVVETTRHRPERRVRIGPLAGFAAGFAVTALAVGALLFMRTQPAPAPAAAHVVAHVKAAPPPPAPALITLEQMAAQYQAAVRLIEQNAAQDARATMQRLADAGFVMAQYRLAKMYERGEGVAADLVQARIWTERAAAGGNRNALHDLGVYFVRGEGAPRDPATAARWFQQAAELGHADSQFNLGVLYAEGRGVQADLWEALFWFRLAANQGDVAAGERAIEIELGLTPYDLEQIDTRIAAFQPRAADPIANGEFVPAQAAVDAAPQSHAVGALPSEIPSDETPR